MNFKSKRFVVIIFAIVAVIVLAITIPIIVASSKKNSECKHTYRPATCTTSKTCSKCGITVGEPLGHDFAEKITKTATCTEKGIRSYTCKRCDYSYNEEYELESFSKEDLYDKAKEFTVEILTYDKNGNELSLGSGFIYKSNGQIATNYHVIEESCAAIVYIGEKDYRVENVLSYNTDLDLAILKINASNLKTPVICSKPVKTGSEIYAMGSSKGLTSTFSQGIVTNTNRIIDGVTYIQHDAPISSGNSGGPLVNKYCEVIGINTLTIKDSQNLNFAIFASELNKLKFGSPMSLKSIYEKECDPYKKLKKYITEKGSINSDNDGYTLILGQYNTSGGTVTIGAIYSTEEDEISLHLLLDDLFFSLYLNESSQICDWSLIDNDSYYYMKGTLNGYTFSQSSTYLSYSSTNIYNYTMKNTFNKLAVTSAQIVIECLNTELTSINVTASDFGFTLF